MCYLLSHGEKVIVGAMALPFCHKGGGMSNRSEAARKAWVTRKAREAALKRGAAARKAWQTRRLG